MNKIEEAYTRFRRITVTPYWCDGSPLRWTDGGIGIAHLAQDGAVGHFNLAWWLLARQQPPAAQVYADTPLSWVILRAPQVMILPRLRWSMTAAASFLTQTEWRQVMTRLDYEAYPHIDGYGVTREMLRRLALHGSY
jgi:hypothetical protein